MKKRTIKETKIAGGGASCLSLLLSLLRVHRCSQSMHAYLPSLVEKKIVLDCATPVSEIQFHYLCRRLLSVVHSYSISLHLLAVLLPFPFLLPSIALPIFFLFLCV